MSKLLNYRQGSTDWLNWRKTKITASEMPKVMGVSPYGTAFELWQEKTGLKEAKEATEVMRQGSLMEEEFRSTFEKMTGVEVMPMCVESDDVIWLGASLDGINLDGSIYVELKMNNKENHQLAASGKMVDHHKVQVQHQWRSLGNKVKKGYYLSYHMGDYQLVEIEPDEAVIKEILTAGKDFDQKIKTLTPPELSDADYINISDEHAMNMAKTLHMLQEQRKSLDKEEEKLKDALIAHAGRNAKIGAFKLSQVIRKGAVSYADIPELKNVDLDKYRKSPTTSWRLTQSKD